MAELGDSPEALSAVMGARLPRAPGSKMPPACLCDRPSL